MPRFCTAINCMDGRVQQPVAEYLKDYFDCDYVDAVTEAGVVAVVAKNPHGHAAKSVFKRVGISINAHNSVGMAVIAHHDCAGNPIFDVKQHEQVAAAVDQLRFRYPGVPVLGLWVNSHWKVQELVSARSG